MRPNHKLQSSEIQTLVRSYQNGTAIKALSRQFQLHEQTVRAHIDRAGVQLRPQRVLTDAQVADLAKAYRAGAPIRQLAAAYNVSYGSIRNHLLRAGVTFARPSEDPVRQPRRRGHSY